MKRIRSEAPSVTNENDGEGGGGDGRDIESATQCRLGAESRRLAAATRRQKVRDEREQRREAAGAYRQRKDDIDAYFRERYVWHAFRLARERATFWYGEMCARFRALSLAAGGGTTAATDTVCNSSSSSSADEVEIARLYLSDPGPESFDRRFEQWRFVAESDMRRVLFVPRLAVHRRPPDTNVSYAAGRLVADGVFSLPLSTWTVEVAGHLSLRDCTALACVCRRLQHAHRTRLNEAARSVLPRLTRICEWHPDRPQAGRVPCSALSASDVRKTTIDGRGGGGDAATPAPRQTDGDTEKKRSTQAMAPRHRRRHLCHPAAQTTAMRAKLEAECATRTSRPKECKCMNYYMLPHLRSRESVERRTLVQIRHEQPSSPSSSSSRFLLVGTSALDMPTGYAFRATGAAVCRCHSRGPSGYAGNSTLARYQSAECYRAGTFDSSAIRLLASTTGKTQDPAQTLVRVLVYCRRLRALAKATTTPECERAVDAWLASAGLDACLS